MLLPIHQPMLNHVRNLLQPQQLHHHIYKHHI
ncbi:unnamed protein product [Spirodela intermedia]|uniref:Uncharacterized protein n=1 Tax=Spirodela intermedia TaxID=51605 RepID=A0A7I8L652_SPIIN|nr:unnamed protein product [Spirodela intermedia]